MSYCAPTSILREARRDAPRRLQPTIAPTWGQVCPAGRQSHFQLAGTGTTRNERAAKLRSRHCQGVAAADQRQEMTDQRCVPDRVIASDVESGWEGCTGGRGPIAPAVPWDGKCDVHYRAVPYGAFDLDPSTEGLYPVFETDQTA